jgi:DNA polymerase III sliding clamp (beta) subunit (PCNA family)
MLKLSHRLAALARLASSAEHAKFNTTCLLVRETQEGFNVVATNGRVLGLVRGDQGNLPATPRLARFDGVKAEALVPARNWQHVLKQAKGREANAVLGPKSIIFEMGDVMETVRLEEGRFPDIGRLLKTQRSVLRVKVDARQLGALLQTATSFADPVSPVVTLHFQASGKPLLVTALTGERLEFEGCVCSVV